jgi:hypothetical protein
MNAARPQLPLDLRAGFELNRVIPSRFAPRT